MTSSSLPPASSPFVVLAAASPSEQRHAWRATHPSWGRGLTLAQYIAREEHLLTHTTLARDGGLTPWILTTTTAGDDPRPVLSSCETLVKRAIVASPDGSSVTDVVAHGVASVFTEPGYRSRGYAGRMMELLGAALARREEALPGAARFSVLFSDIGPRFYANHQWKPMGNMHLAFPVDGGGGGGGGGGVPSTSTPARITELTDQHLEALTARDEQLLRAQLSQPIAAGARHTVRVAVLPDYATLEWHFRREDHHMLGNLPGPATPRVRGALYTPPTPGNDASDTRRRVWGFWVRSRSDGGSSSSSSSSSSPVVTVLHFLRLVVEDDAQTSDEELAAALDGIIEVARREAAGCGASSVEMWNPSARVAAVFRERLPQLQGSIVQRDESSLASLRWFGAGSVDDVEWVANEKFAWC